MFCDLNDTSASIIVIVALQSALALWIIACQYLIKQGTDKAGEQETTSTIKK